MVGPTRIPLTVIGGYLGSGKTTLVNHLLQHAEGRRIGVIVNDFGSVGIDAALLAAGSGVAAGERIISLPNGCVCCTIGSGLHDALAALLELDPAPDHIVVEVSGVADPATAAAWATVPPFEAGGVVVLAANVPIIRHRADRISGGEVVRQLAGADLILLTKSDLCEPSAVENVERWLGEVTGGTPRVSVDHGDAPASVVLGLVPGKRRAGDLDASPDHIDRYFTWEWDSTTSVSRDGLGAFLADLPGGILRLKGFIALDDGSQVVVQRVGDRSTVEPRSNESAVSTESACTLVAIGVRDLVDPATLTRLAQTHFC